MTFTNSIAASVAISATILGLYSPPVVLSWIQRNRRYRAFSIVLLICATCVFPSVIANERIRTVLTYLVLLAVSSLAMRHLRRSSNIWAHPRLAIFTRLFSIVAACGLATIGLKTPEALIICAVFSGVWFALVIRAENIEMTGYFRDLQMRLVSMEASRQSIQPIDPSAIREPRDNSIKAS
jgi:hypothetical protein